MATEIGQLQWTIGADNTELKDKLEESTKQMNKFSKSIDAATSVSKVLLSGLAIAGGAAIGFGVASVRAFQESEQAVAQLEAMIKSTGGAAGVTSEEFQALALELQGLTGVSDEAVIASEAMLGTFTEIKGGVIKDATKTVLDMATAMNSGAIPSAEEMRAQSIQLGKALNNPKEGLTALTKVGVTFTEAQKEQITALQDSGKMAEAQTVILQELQKEFGGSAEAAGKTFTGQINIAKETFGGFMEEVGAAIVKYLQPMVEKFNAWSVSVGGAEGMLNLLITKFQEIKTWMEDHIAVIIAVAGAIGGILVSAFVAWAVAAAQAAVATIVALAPVILIGAAIGVLAYLIYKHWDAIKLTFIDAKNEIIYIAGIIGTNLAKMYEVITSPFKRAFDWVVDYIKNIPNRVKDSINQIKGLFDKLNPFHRESPSLVDNVKSGLDVITDQYNNMKYRMPDVPVAQVGTLTAGTQLASEQKPASVSAARPERSEVHIHVGMFAGTAQELRKIAETITAEQSRIGAAVGAA